MTLRPLALFLLFFHALAYAQVPVHCGTASLHEISLQAPRYHESVIRSEAHYRQWVQSAPRGGGVKMIPVVVHIIQQSDIEEISDARVKAQIDVLNEDFRHLAGTPGFGAGVDTDIEFCLASIDPNGCPTTGINRVIAPALAWHDMADEAQLKGLIQWDPEQYMNMWVPHVITGGILGYARFPQTLLNNPALDGVVINGGFFGRGAGTPVSAYDQGRTATHEVGHWLGLHHTFNGGCAGMSPADCDSLGDAVCDTPPTSNSNFGCPGPQNTCAESPVDADDQTRNYMDYTNDLCMDLYTAGQADRMHFFLSTIRTDLWSPANLAATGCDGSVSAGCTPIAQFAAAPPFGCTGLAIQFTDLSAGPASSWHWTFQGGTPATDTVANPTVVYNTPGLYQVTLIVTNAFGSDTLVQQQYVNISAAAAPPVAEGFESAPALPAGWALVNGDNMGAWHASNLASTEGSWAMVFDNYTDSTYLQPDDLISHPVDLSSPASAQLTFDRSYRKFNSFRPDVLQVLVSTDCGLSWDTAWSAFGDALTTVAGIYPSQPWVPASTADWQTTTVNLQAWLGHTNVRFKFRNISRGGQAIWIDRINLGELVDVPAGLPGTTLTVYPNPATEAPVISISNAQPGGIHLQLISLAGCLVWEWKAEELNSVEVQLSRDSFQSLPAGMYLLQMQNGGLWMSRRLVIVH